MSCSQKPGDMSSDKVPVYSSATEVLQKLQESYKSKNITEKPYPAMFSSIFGGIILDPCMMLIPIDDHMVHRGHGVFDTAMLLDGYLYELDTHLDRFLKSASNARIDPPFSREIMRNILIQMTAVSKCKKGSIRYWLSAGPGDFLLSSKGCPESAFYAIVIADNFTQSNSGVKCITSTIPMKPPLFSTVKNVNYLPNVLSVLEAESRGAFSSIWVDENGFIAEGPNVNVAFITKNKELIVPDFGKILGGCTAKRLLDLGATFVERGILGSVKNEGIRVSEAKECKEMMYVGSGLPILPIVEWDGVPIGDRESWRGDNGSIGFIMGRYGFGSGENSCPL